MIFFMIGVICNRFYRRRNRLVRRGSGKGLLGGGNGALEENWIVGDDKNVVIHAWRALFCNICNIYNKSIDGFISIEG